MSQLIAIVAMGSMGQKKGLEWLGEAFSDSSEGFGEFQWLPPASLTALDFCSAQRIEGHGVVHPSPQWELNTGSGK